MSTGQSQEAKQAKPSAPTAERKWKLYIYPDGSISLPSQANRGGKTITVIEEVLCSAPTADVEEIARELAGELRPLLLHSAQVNTVRDMVVKPMILQALAQVRAPLVGVLEGIAQDCEEVSRDESVTVGEKRAWLAVARKAKRAALTGTGEKKA